MEAGLRTWDTTSVDAPLRLAHWAGAWAEALAPMQVGSPVADVFGGQLQRLALGELALVRADAAPLHANRAALPAGRARQAPLLLLAQAAQPWTLRHGGHLMHLRPGDVALVDSAQAFELHFPQGCGLVGIVLPRSLASRWLAEPAACSGRVAWREQGWGRTLSALCLQLADDLLLAHAYPAGHLPGQLGALLAATYGEPPAVPAEPAGDLVARTEALMRRRLDEAGLTSGALAQALEVSLRTLHRAHAGAGTPVAAVLRRLRMERAAELLGSAALGRLPIAEIGLRCGYADASHFAREFRRAWGVSPAAWRQRKAAPALRLVA